MDTAHATHTPTRACARTGLGLTAVFLCALECHNASTAERAMAVLIHPCVSTAPLAGWAMTATRLVCMAPPSTASVSARLAGLALVATWSARVMVTKSMARAFATHCLVSAASSARSLAALALARIALATVCVWWRFHSANATKAGLVLVVKSQTALAHQTATTAVFAALPPIHHSV